MVRAMVITADSLLLRPKLDCDEGYDVAVKGPSVIVHGGNIGLRGDKAVRHDGGATKQPVGS